ncbi:uncharacterized protein CIMG_01468 [Coccidioides immitis RS]|uniref:Uncharacterized protein n=1 Tax=Coccidioides immitis (strain RS) TaxID=246410 RepID=A0A0E1RYQ8_COCIM|nr:uncharacterized protein CIMG_01468 [Coccidioides immitis RS]EAS36114.1 hypothetical protein CIMG_01468 [Coccidioides immitis RS]TPX25726.1 hypothetical protein DIZ76_011183 [Coccidioides immitis]
MSYSASKTWVSPQTKELETWTKIRDSIMRISPRSPFIPKTFADWLEHRVAIKEDQLRKVARKIARISGRDDRQEITIHPVLGVKEIEDRRALVLARETIWRQSLESFPGRRLAPWPSYEEYKHEGDDRSKSGYRRFLPLPRDPGNVTVNWKQRKPLPQYLFDEVGRRTTVDNEEDKEPGLDELLAMEFVGASLILLLDS